MFTLQELIANGVVTEEQFRELDEDVKITARRQSAIHRQLVKPLGPIGLGKTRYDYDVLTEMGEAIWDLLFPQGGEDTILQARDTVDIPVLEKKFKIAYRNLLASQTSGQALDTLNAGSAAFRLADLMGEFITQGLSRDGSTYDINGLYQAANNTFAGADFGTAGNGIKAVAGGQGVLMADNINPPYNLSLHPVQFAELAGSVHTGGINEFQRVLQQLGGGQIFSNSHLTAGTGMMTATAEQGFLNMVIGQDVTSELWKKSPDPRADVMGRAFMAMTMVITDTDAISTLTGI